MKLIHCADIHLGSKMEAKLPREKAAERRAEVRATFDRMVSFAAREGVRAVLLSGDVFDSDRPLKKDKEYFYQAVKAHPEIDFLYLRGNHDGLESYEEEPENLKTFFDEWRTYSYDGLDVSGVELVPQNAYSLYSSLRLRGDRLNVVMLHGQIGAASGDGLVNLGKLREKQIDYLALGHLHSYSEGKLDERGRYVYSGCLEGRGFDETGRKGFVLLNTDGGRIGSVFVPFARRTIWEKHVDLTGAQSFYAAVQSVKNSLEGVSGADLVRVLLEGELSFENDSLAADVGRQLSGEYYFASVKDNTLRRLDLADYEGDISLKGEFVRGVLRGNYSEEEKRKIIAVGLRALSGREAD